MGEEAVPAGDALAGCEAKPPGEFTLVRRLCETCLHDGVLEKAMAHAEKLEALIGRLEHEARQHPRTLTSGDVVRIIEEGRRG